MAVQFSSDFTGTDGTAPAGMTLTVDTGALAATIQSNTLQWARTGGSTNNQGWLIVDSLTLADSDQYLKFQPQTSSARNHGLLARYSSPSSRYRARVESTSVIELSGGGLTTVEVATSFVAGNWYWLRFRAVGSDLWVKFWADGSAEPTTGGLAGTNDGWDIKATDATLTTGSVGIYGFLQTTSTLVFDDYSVDDTLAAGGVDGTGTATLPAFTAAGSATVTENTVTAAGTAALPAFAAAGSGTVTTAGSVEEFDAATIPDGWEYVDSKGDVPLTFADGCAVMTLPAASSHDSLPSTTDPRLLTAAPAGAWEVTASFRSQVRYPATQGHGIVVTNSSNAVLIRADLYGDNGGTCRIYLRHGSTNVVAGVAVPRGVWGGSPSHLRLTFDGTDGWTFSSSVNGFDWDVHGSFTASLAVAKVGVHALNAGSPVPAYTMRLDRFTFDGSMPAEPAVDQGSVVIAEPFDGAASDPWPTGRWSDASINGGFTEQNGDGTAAIGHSAGPDSTGRALTTTANLRDIRIAGRAKFRSNNGDHASFLAFALRGTGGWGDIYSPVNSYAIERNHKDGALRLFRVTQAGAVPQLDDAYHLLQQADDVVYANVDTLWHEFEFECFGPWVRFRIWPDGSAKPAAWNIKAVDFVNDTAGEVGLAYAQTWAQATVDAETADVADLEVYALEAYSVSGTGSASLPAFTSSGNATATVETSGSASLPAFTAAGAGAVDTDTYGGDTVTATGLASLPAFTADGAGVASTSTSGTATLPAFTASGSGATTAAATGTAGLPAFTATGTATVTEATPVTGGGTATFPAFTAAGTGTSDALDSFNAGLFTLADSLPERFDVSDSLPRRFHAPRILRRAHAPQLQRRVHEADPLLNRFHTAYFVRLNPDEELDMAITVVTFGTITTRTSMLPFWVRWVDRVLKAGADGSGGDADYTDTPFPLTDGAGAPLYTGTLTLTKSGAVVRDMTLTIPDPANLASIDATNMAGRSGEVGWSYAEPITGDFNTASPATPIPDEWDTATEHYALQAHAARISDGLVLAPPTAWMPTVKDGPATLSLATP